MLSFHLRNISLYLVAVSADVLHIAVVILSFVCIYAHVGGIVGVIVDVGSVKNTSHQQAFLTMQWQV